MGTNLEKVAVAASVACIIKFLLEGVSITIAGQPLSLGHADPVTYGMLLGPLWGGHAYLQARVRKPKSKVGNPDAK